jgi:hypothetical protein
MAAGPPRPEQSAELPADLLQIGQRPRDVLQLDVDETQDVRARRLPGALERRNPLDLIQPEAKPSRLSDEYEQRQRVVGVDAIPRGRAAGWR